MRHQQPRSQKLLFHLLQLSQVLSAGGPGSRPRGPPDGLHTMRLTRGRGHLIIHPSFCIASFCALCVHPMQRTWELAGQAGWILRCGKVLSMPRPMRASPLGPEEFHTHVEFRKLFLCLPELIAKKTARDLPCCKSGAPKSTPVYKSHTFLQPAKGRYCVSAPIRLTDLSLPLHTAT